MPKGPLVTQTTDLRSLKYGKDRPFGGNSKQPFIQTPINNGPVNPSTEKFGTEISTSTNDPSKSFGNTGGVDQLVRGGSLLPVKLSDDVRRISKFLTTEQGINFLAKQEGLYIAENIRLYGLDPRNWKLIYNPLSPIINTTLAPTGINTPNIFNFKKPSTNIARQSKYQEGNTYRLDSEKIIASYLDRTDKLTTTPLYFGKQVDPTISQLDTVPFYITVINNDGKGVNTYLHFRAYIEGLSDAYAAEWNAVKYMGRGENFYYYNGFNRDISFNFKVPVLSLFEQQSVYSKLNYLASIMAPDYTDGGFMRGNLIKVTIGDYLVDVPGVVTGFTFAPNEDAGWDVARTTSKTSLDKQGKYITPPTTGGLSPDAVNNDSGGYIMPRLIEVSGFQFKPIHTFIPSKVQNIFVDYGAQYNNSPFISFDKADGSTNYGGGYGWNQAQADAFKNMKEQAAKASAEVNALTSTISPRGLQVVPAQVLP